MQRFKDKKGTEWSVNIHYVSIEKVQEDTGFDLLTLATGESDSMKQFAEPKTLFRILHSLLDSQIEKLDADDKELEFAERMVGDPISDAADCIIEGVYDFFPSQKAAPLRLAHAKIKAAEKRMAERMMANVEGEKFEQAINSQLGQLEKKFTAAVESLGSQSQDV